MSRINIKNFIIIFNGKEGTSPLVRLLDNFEEVCMVHQSNQKGWEPFDEHNCGLMKLKDLGMCLKTIFNQKKETLDAEKLNHVYLKTAKAPLRAISKKGSVGFKMRLKAPLPKYRWISKPLSFFRKHYGLFENMKYEKMMIDLFKKEQIVVFIVVRRDLFRWALSKYHGDGTGKKGNLQFKIAEGQLKKEEIPKINVDLDSFEKVIDECKYLVERKNRLYRKLKAKNIATRQIFYEDFCEDKVSYFKQFFDCLNYPMPENAIEEALGKGAYFEKVHSNDISHFVINHEELTAKFGHEQIPQ